MLSSSLRRFTNIGHGLPEVCRLGLATRGGTRLKAVDAERALDCGLNYWNWCGHTDGLSIAIARLGERRREVVVAVQFKARSRVEAAREFSNLLDELKTSYIDILTFYYVESSSEWEEIVAPGGAWEYLNEEKQRGRLKMIGITTHQRPLVRSWAPSGRLDMLMVRYNMAHRGAEEEVFPVAAGLPVVTFTGLRWKALLRGAPDDPPSFSPPTAAECYRFCLANPSVSVALAAPGDRQELEHALTLLDDWRMPDSMDLESLRAYGVRIHRHASTFW
ncbi:MAG: hypothetical protein GY953_44495 [bacterium]|nr:hypothetical protein [bacterium]